MSNSIAIWMGVAVAGFAGLLAVMRFVRRSLERRAKSMSFDFSINDLHVMMTSGQISPQEFERAKALVLAKRGAIGQDSGRVFAGRAFEVQPIAKNSDLSSKPRQSADGRETS